MPESLEEVLKARERRAFLKAHEGDKTFPLDGSDWARLIREKQFLEQHPHCRCESCDNFLTRLHRKDSLLKRQRGVIVKAMHHWFLQEEKIGSLYWTMREQLTAHELAKSNVVGVSKHPSNLIDAEKDWLSQKIYASRDKKGLLGDEAEEEFPDSFPPVRVDPKLFAKDQELIQEDQNLIEADQNLAEEGLTSVDHRITSDGNLELGGESENENGLKMVFNVPKEPDAPEENIPSWEI